MEPKCYVIIKQLVLMVMLSDQCVCPPIDQWCNQNVHTIIVLIINFIIQLPIIFIIHSAAGTASLWWPHFRSWNLFKISTAPASWGPSAFPSSITHFVAVISHDWSLDFDVFLCEKLNRLTIFSFDFEGRNYFAMIARGKIMELTARSRAEVTDVGIFCSLKKFTPFLK